MKIRFLTPLFICFTALAGSSFAPASVPRSGTTADAAAAPPIVWHDVTTWGVEGRAWTDQKRLRYFDRFPAAAEANLVPMLWTISRSSTGMMARFQSDATVIYVRYHLFTAQLASPLMPATGFSGIDLYARDAAGRWRWVNATHPATQQIETKLAEGLAPGFREYAAYLPPYNGVDSLEIGVPPGARFEGLAPRPNPIVFYGTSVTQGGTVSRPGMLYTAILGRHLDLPVINLGFGGYGRMDAAVGALMAQIDARLYFIGCLANMQADDVRRKCVPLIRQLRAARPRTPIVLFEDRRYTVSWLMPAETKHNEDNIAALRESYAQLQKEGVPGLSYLKSNVFFGDDDEGAVDGSHPSDLGSMRQAEVMEPELRKILGLVKAR